MGLAIPPRGSSTSWSSGDGREPYDRLVNPSSDFMPASECSPAGRDTVLQCLLLSRGLLPFGATQPERATTPGVASSRSCCVPAVPAGFDALLPSRSPRCVSTGRARGVHPSELDTAKIACVSRRSLPSCDWRCGATLPNGPAARRTRLPGPVSGSVAFRLQRMTRWSSGAPRGVPCVPDRRRPVDDHRHIRTAGPVRPRFRGFLPSSRWDAESASLRSDGTLALLGFLLPGAFPFPALACSVTAPTVRPSASALAATPGSRPRRRVCARYRDSPVRPPPRYFRQVPFRVRYPVLQSFKEPGNRLTSFEVAGPSEVFILVPSASR
jgi:hypothetical protein